MLMFASVIAGEICNERSDRGTAHRDRHACHQEQSKRQQPTPAAASQGAVSAELKFKIMRRDHLGSLSPPTRAIASHHSCHWWNVAIGVCASCGRASRTARGKNIAVTPGVLTASLLTALFGNRHAIGAQ
jgi:hypothetical protein